MNTLWRAAVPKNDILEPIRVRAYYLWEQAGRPEGGDLMFWDQARKEIETEEEQNTSLASEG
jgi:hypothetical protein